MLKKFRSTDIDMLMNIWKKEYITTNKKISAEQLTQRYTEVRDLFLSKTSNTILYTEDDVIEGFITINKDNEIALIYVDKKIRREGIGSVLIEACKKSYNYLYASCEEEKDYYINFFEKNGFEKIDSSNSNINKFKWENCAEQKVSLIYFDDDLNEKLLSQNSNIRVKKIEIKDILAEDKQLKRIKNYMKIRKNIEQAFSQKVLLYLNYGNYNEVIDDIVKEIVKIQKTEFAIVVSEPLIIENSKMETYLNKIEQSYKDYKIHVVDTMSEIKKDISVNKILEEKMAVIVHKIEKIAESM